MRKQFCIVLLICVMLLSACQNEADNSSTGPTVLRPGQLQDGFTSNLSLPNFFTVESYEKYFAENSGIITEAFIPYQTIAAFGDFVHLQMNLYNDDGVYVRYTYTLKDETDYEYMVTFDHLFEGTLTAAEDDSYQDSVTDMRTHPSSDSKQVFYNGLYYYYALGEIMCIEWNTETCRVLIYLEDSYPLSDPDSILAKLLSTDGADVAEALQMLSLQPVA